MVRPFVEASPETLAGDVDQRHAEDEQQHQGTDVHIDELADNGVELLPNAACAHEDDNRRCAHIDLKAQLRVAGEVGEHLRNHCVAEDLKPVPPSRLLR
jgi:hypothetical protein